VGRTPRGTPVPNPTNTRDAAVVEEGPDREEIAKLLDKLSRIAYTDYRWRLLRIERKKVFERLDELGVTLFRMVRVYSVGGKSIITHVGILSAMGRLHKPKPTEPKPEPEPEGDA